MKKTVSEKENTHEGIKGTLDEAEHRIRNLEDKVVKNHQLKQ